MNTVGISRLDERFKFRLTYNQKISLNMIIVWLSKNCAYGPTFATRSLDYSLKLHHEFSREMPSLVTAAVLTKWSIAAASVTTACVWRETVIMTGLSGFVARMQSGLRLSSPRFYPFLFCFVLFLICRNIVDRFVRMIYPLGIAHWGILTNMV